MVSGAVMNQPYLTNQFDTLITSLVITGSSSPNSSNILWKTGTIFSMTNVMTLLSMRITAHR